MIPVEMIDELKEIAPHALRTFRQHVTEQLDGTHMSITEEALLSFGYAAGWDNALETMRREHNRRRNG